MLLCSTCLFLLSWYGGAGRKMNLVKWRHRSGFPVFLCKFPILLPIVRGELPLEALQCTASSFSSHDQPAICSSLDQSHVKEPNKVLLC